MAWLPWIFFHSREMCKRWGKGRRGWSFYLNEWSIKSIVIWGNEWSLRKCFCLTPLMKLERGGGKMVGNWLSPFEIETSRGQASVTGRCPGGICRRSRSPTNSLSWKIENKEGSGEIEAVKYLEPIIAIMTLDQDHYTPSRPFWVIMIVTLATDFFLIRKLL